MTTMTTTMTEDEYDKTKVLKWGLTPKVPLYWPDDEEGEQQKEEKDDDDDDDDDVGSYPYRWSKYYKEDTATTTEPILFQILKNKFRMVLYNTKFRTSEELLLSGRISCNSQSKTSPQLEVYPL